MTPQEKAEKEIGQILARLEKETGQIVEDVFLTKINVTTLDDKAERMAMSFRVHLKRIPGHDWS